MAIIGDLISLSHSDNRKFLSVHGIKTWNGLLVYAESVFCDYTGIELRPRGDLKTEQKCPLSATAVQPNPRLMVSFHNHYMAEIGGAHQPHNLNSTDFKCIPLPNRLDRLRLYVTKQKDSEQYLSATSFGPKGETIKGCTAAYMKMFTLWQQSERSL